MAGKYAAHDVPAIDDVLDTLAGYLKDQRGANQRLKQEESSMRRGGIIR